MLVTRSASLSIAFAMLLSGCSSSEDPQPAQTASNNQAEAVEETPPAQEEPGMEPESTEAPRAVRRGPISLSGSSSTSEESTASTKSTTSASGDSADNSTFEALKPLQILMGDWEGKTRRLFDGFAAVDEPAWKWDFLSDRKQPALVMDSEDSPYYEQVRLTYDTKDDQFVMTMKHQDYGQRILKGGFTQEIRDVPGDDDKLHRTYKIELTQFEPADDTEMWQVVINQQDNNRYLMEMSKKRGSARFVRIDTVAAQRQGTSFALSDSDYGDKTCIVSGGLGTSTVSYMGKTYYVCCSGCDAAFKEEPERWIAKALAEMEKDTP